MGVKLVMEEKEGPKVIIGISNDNCDPIIETVEGYIEDALGKVYRLLRKAETQWNTAPHYPEYKVPIVKPVSTPKETEKPASETKKEEKSTKTRKPGTKKPKKETKSKKNIPENIPTEAKSVEIVEVTVEVPIGVETEAEESPTLTETVTPQLPLLADEPEPEQKCRVCGCTEDHACEGGCSWVEKDLCSACVDKEEKKTGLFLKDGSGPFSSVQEALDAYGAPKDTRPQHNRWDRLSRAWKEIIIRKG